MAAPNSDTGYVSKHRALSDELRAVIVREDFAPGQRLPRRMELMAGYQVSAITLQRAMDQLAREGFIESRGRAGTFVTQRPPHRNRYVVALPMAAPPGPVRPTISLDRALEAQAAAITASTEQQVDFQFGVSPDLGRGRYERLLADVRARRLSGIIFGSSPWPLGAEAIGRLAQVPCAVIASAANDWGIPALYPDIQQFMDMAFARLAAQGRRRVAIIGRAYSDPNRASFGPLAARHGLELPPHWQLLFDQSTHSPGIRHTPQLLLSLPPEQRPDAIVISDETLAVSVSAGIAASGVSVPDELRVICHASRQYPPQLHVPADLLTYDVRAMLELAMQRIDQQAAGQDVPAFTPVDYHYLAPPAH